MNSIEDRVDLTAIRGEATAGVAPLWITVEAVQLGQRPGTGAPGGPAGSTGQAPPPGASVCVLQGTSGQTILNSPMGQWGVDGMGLLQTVMSTQIVTFPETAIGRGATWTISTVENNDGVIENQTWTYQLNAVDDAGFELAGTATSSWDQPVRTPQSISQGDDMIRSSTITFRVSSRFDQPFPTSATINGSGSMRSASLKFAVEGTSVLEVDGH